MVDVPQASKENATSPMSPGTAALKLNTISSSVSQDNLCETKTKLGSLQVQHKSFLQTPKQQYDTRNSEGISPLVKWVTHGTDDTFMDQINEIENERSKLEESDPRTLS